MGLERLAEDAFDSCLPLLMVQPEALGGDVRELGRSGDADEQHLVILDDLVGEVLQDANVLGSLPSTYDVVSPLDARRVVDRRGRRVGETHTLEELAEAQDLSFRRRNSIVLLHCRRQSSSLLHLGFPLDWSLVLKHQVS